LLLFVKLFQFIYIVCADTVLNFIRSHPLMDAAVSHENGKPIFYKRDLLFTHLVVDKLKIDLFGSDLEYIVYYAGTSKYSNPYIEIQQMWNLKCKIIPVIIRATGIE